MSLTFSRRSFLKYTAVAAVAVAGSSLLTGCKDNPYQPEGAFGKDLKVMGTFNMSSPVYDAANKKFTCNVYVKCTSENPLYVTPESFMVEVTTTVDKKDVTTSYFKNQGQNNDLTLETAAPKLEKNKEHNTKLIVGGITIPEGAKVSVTYWPRAQASGGNMTYTKAFATWKGTYKNGKIE